eukprot:IDg17552t1
MAYIKVFAYPKPLNSSVTALASRLNAACTVDRQRMSQDTMQVTDLAAMQQGQLERFAATSYEPRSRNGNCVATCVSCLSKENN